MAARRRTILLAMLALAAPLPAFAISDSSQSVDAASGPAAISVSTSLDSCGVLDSRVVCKLDVSFTTLPNADTYSASVTSADGSVVDYGGVPAGGTSFWVPYVGAGTYSVRITAYGTPETADDPGGRGNVIATGDSRALTDHAPQPPQAPSHAGDNATSVSGAATGPAADQNSDADGSTDSEVAPAPAADPAPACPTTTTPAPTAEPPPAAPVPPAPDTDPNNPDEDGDGISDADEQAAYEQQLAAYHAVIAAQQAPVAPAPPPGC